MPVLYMCYVCFHWCCMRSVAVLLVVLTAAAPRDVFAAGQPRGQVKLKALVMQLQVGCCYLCLQAHTVNAGSATHSATLPSVGPQWGCMCACGWRCSSPHKSALHFVEQSDNFCAGSSWCVMQTKLCILNTYEEVTGGHRACPDNQVTAASGHECPTDRSAVKVLPLRATSWKAHCLMA